MDGFLAVSKIGYRMLHFRYRNGFPHVGYRVVRTPLPGPRIGKAEQPVYTVALPRVR